MPSASQNGEGGRPKRPSSKPPVSPRATEVEPRPSDPRPRERLACGKCGAIPVSGAKFCEQCGNPVDFLEVTVMRPAASEMSPQTAPSIEEEPAAEPAVPVRRVAWKIAIAVVLVALVAGGAAVAINALTGGSGEAGGTGGAQSATWRLDVVAAQRADRIRTEAFGGGSFGRSGSVFTPKAGSTFIVVDVTVADRSGADRATVASDQFSLRTPGGSVVTADGAGGFLTDGAQSSEAVSLGSGGCMSCKLTKTSPSSSSVDLRLVFVVGVDSLGDRLTLQFRDVPPIELSVERGGSI